MPNYKITIRYSKEDKCYLAEIPELPGCIADGETIHEAVRAVKKLAENWIDIAIEDGEIIPQSSEDKT